MKVYVILASGFEEIEALAVVDILRRAEISVTTFSLNNDIVVEGAHGIKVCADKIFEDFDMDLEPLKEAYKRSLNCN